MRACMRVRVCVRARQYLCFASSVSVSAFVRCQVRLYLCVLSVVAGKEQQLVLRHYKAQILTVLALPATTCLRRCAQNRGCCGW